MAKLKLDVFMGVGVSVTLTTLVVMLLAEHVTAVIEQLAKAADTDYLTGLSNRRAFDAEFRRQSDRAQRSGLPLALALFDLDLDDAVTFSERIGRELQRRTHDDGPALSVSAGVAALADCEPTPAGMLVAADCALYAAKAAGRRRVAMWQDGATHVGVRMDAERPLIVDAA